jgi:glycosyltransferase involved in cell wall biosynthesis
MLACWSRWAADSAVMEMGVSPERVVLHKPCIDRPVQPPSAPTPSPERDDPARRVRIAFVGNDFERKGGDRLLRWHQARWRSRAEIHVCSAKVQPDRSLEGVVWHGATPHAKLTTEILPSCDLFVMPTWEDTFLIAAQEALVAGLPVVTSRLAGIPEVVRDERTGFLCAPADESGFISAIERLLDDASLRANMSRAAREHAERNLSGHIWHNHLLDQLVALAEGRPTRYAPEGVDIRNSEREPGNPASQAESVARAAAPSRSAASAHAGPR